jgi:16S rRNA (uracil1498-N3)-methyltransferase
VRLTRVYVAAPLGANESALLEGDAANHIMRVLRLRVGDALTLFDGRGGEYGGRIAGMRRGGVEVEIGGHRAIERESPLDVTLLQSVARGERMDLIVQKTTELGVTRIVPVISERTLVRLEAEQAGKKLAHWRGVAVAACEQCGRNRVPEIAQPRLLPEALDAHTKDPSAHADKLVLDPEASAALASRVAGSSAFVLLIGPEGGLTETETELAVRAGFQPYRMGPRILRAETAAVACLAAIQATAGDLGT